MHIYLEKNVASFQFEKIVRNYLENLYEDLSTNHFCFIFEK